MDEKIGHRTRIKLLINYRVPMSSDGMAHWGKPMRKHIAKSPWVFKNLGSSNQWKDKFPPDGMIEVQNLASREAIADFMFNNFPVDEKITYYLFGWTIRKSSYEDSRTGKHLGLTKALCKVQILNVEKRIVKVYDTNRISHYWFWKEHLLRRNRED